MVDQSFNNVPFFYEFQADFVFLNQDNEIVQKKSNKEFKNENLIIAREKAIQYYQNYIDGMLESLNITYIDDLQAKNILIDYFNEVSDRMIEIEGKQISLKKPLRCTIGVYFHQGLKAGKVSEDEWNEFYGFEDIFKDIPEWNNFKKPIFLIFNPYLIHGIFYFNGHDIDPISIVKHLKTEFNCYSKNHFETNKYRTNVKITYTDINEHEQFGILQTPYKWERVETISDEPEYIPSAFNTDNLAPTIGLFSSSSAFEIIERGESKTVEFKPALFNNYKTKKKDTGLICAKPICAFLNSQGGLLFIGVKDDKTIQGIDSDFSLIKKTDLKDGLLLELSTMINKFFPPFVHNFLKAEFCEISKKTILIIIISPSDKPVLLKNKNDEQIDKEFHIRGFANNQRLTELEGIIEYIVSHWFSKGF